MFCYYRKTTLLFWSSMISAVVICTLFWYPRTFRHVITGELFYMIGFIIPTETGDFTASLFEYLRNIILSVVIVFFPINSLAKRKLSASVKRFVEKGEVKQYIVEVNGICAHVSKQKFFSKKEKMRIIDNVKNEFFAYALFENGEIENATSLLKDLLKRKNMELKIAFPTKCNILLLLMHISYLRNNDSKVKQYRLQLTEQIEKIKKSDRVGGLFKEHYLAVLYGLDKVYGAEYEAAKDEWLEIQKQCKNGFDMVHVLCLLAIIEHELYNDEMAQQYLLEAKSIAPEFYSVYVTELYIR